MGDLYPPLRQHFKVVPPAFFKDNLELLLPLGIPFVFQVVGETLVQHIVNIILPEIGLTGCIFACKENALLEIVWIKE